MSLSFRRTVASSVQYMYVYVYKSHQQNYIIAKKCFFTKL